jgi:hypothetical protein
MIRFLENLSKILDKAVAQANARNMPLSDLIDARLAPDMFPFPQQIQIASDIAKLAAGRLAGMAPPSFRSPPRPIISSKGATARVSNKEPPRHEDNQSTSEELKARIAKTIDYLKSVPREKFDGAEDRTITLKFPQGEINFVGRDFATNFALSNFFFHVTTAYDILRHKGIEIGKMDYLGGP